MPLNLRDPYIHRDSPIHRCPAEIKLPLALLTIIGVVVLPFHLGMIAASVGGMLLIVFIISNLPIVPLLKRMVLLEPFVLMVALLSLLQPEGWRVFLSLTVKGTLSLSIMVLLVATTRFTDIVRALWKFRVPSMLVTTLSLMYRYLFVMVEEVNRLSRARASRTFVDTKRSIWQSAADVAGQLFVRTSLRAERVFAAMCARGWKT